VEAGPDAGEPLEVRPLLRCDWSSWRRLHPDTRLAWWHPRPAHRLLHRLGGHELVARRVPEERMSRPLDLRLPPGEQVFALASGGQAHAFTRPFLRKHHRVELRLGSRPAVVLYDPALDVAQAFWAELEGSTLSLEPWPGLHAVARSPATDDLWDAAGRCLRGPHHGRRLAPVPLSVDRVYWFAWAHFHPETGLDALPRLRPAQALWA
jgi:hypothetical protein